MRNPHFASTRATHGGGARSAVCLLTGSLFASAGAAAEPVTSILQNGDPANRVDIAVLGDGYTTTELGQYAADVDQYVLQLFSEEPFLEYARYFNVHRIDVTSNESGADHSERTPPLYVDTALDSTYNCAGIQRLICVDDSKVTSILGDLEADERDIIVVLVNDLEDGGSGGAFAVSSLNYAVVQTILHEIGHTFGLLADEYGGGEPTCGDPSLEPSAPNATKETVRTLIKWNHWIDDSTPIPTTAYSDGVPGLYEGAQYCETGLYRPTYDSLMRRLFRPFEQINGEQLVRRIYNWVSPLEAVTPLDPLVQLPYGETLTFEVTVPQPLTHSLNIAWAIDDVEVGTGPIYEARPDAIAAGLHRLTVVVSDPTSLVRSDPTAALTDSHEWLLSVERCGDGSVDPIEECDDANTVAGDGCSPTCFNEECGSGSTDPGEQCDDGNLEDGDGCDSNCTPTACGNDIVTSEEQCDDGNSADEDDCSNTCHRNVRFQTRDQIRCIVNVNKGIARVARAQGKANQGCLEHYVDRRLGTSPTRFADCLEADSNGTVARARQRLKRLERNHCSTAELPDLVVGGDRLSGSPAAGDLPLLLVRQLLGGAPITSPGSGEEVATCQTQVMKQANRLFQVIWDEILAAKAQALKGNGSVPTLNDRVITEAIFRALLTSTRVAKATEKLRDRVVDACDQVTSLLPIRGCAQSDVSAVADCVDESARCRACQLLLEADVRLSIDCDEFDNAVADRSCES